MKLGESFGSYIHGVEIPLSVGKSKNGPYFNLSNHAEKCIHGKSPSLKNPDITKEVYDGLAKDHPLAAHHAEAVYIAEKASKEYLEYIIDKVVRGNKDKYTDWAILRFLGYKVEINPCDSDYSLVYSLNTVHPSGNISNSGNKVFLKKLCQKDKSIKTIKTEILGTFKNQPSKYDMYYSSTNKPFNGYSRYSYYNGTQYEGLREHNFYASKSYNELVNKVKSNTDQCKRQASNYSWGRLDRNDNFWTYFCPKSGLVSTLNSIWSSEKEQ